MPSTKYLLNAYYESSCGRYKMTSWSLSSRVVLKIDNLPICVVKHMGNYAIKLNN